MQSQTNSKESLCFIWQFLRACISLVYLSLTMMDIYICVLDHHFSKNVKSQTNVEGSTPVTGKFFAEFYSLIQLWQIWQNDQFTEKLDSSNSWLKKSWGLQILWRSLDLQYLWIGHGLELVCFLIFSTHWVHLVLTLYLRKNW